MAGRSIGLGKADWRSLQINPAHRMNQLTLQLHLRKIPTQERSVEATGSLYVSGVEIRVTEHMNRVRPHERNDQLAHRLDEEPVSN
ncbi:MAG: hypothetical protein F4Y08_08720 [Caldilineaceae bacterium SB0662_bin_9]|uniref:Uncharacterized protein n=1 Tax=Caldilineaceae bacterium SB0662_bin_9 TaxID=2605258 RepID=A0A6B1DRR2_9CHLR|nr:hypothetical protein [Caldilineaceae bacterium]MYD90400.1 hypothetical protein [Caldilineaceae bacterium SB0662_bin_9]